MEMDGSVAARRVRRPFAGRVVWFIIPLVAVAGLFLLFIPRSSGPGASAAKPTLLGTVLTKRMPAPTFRLHDQFGRPVTMAEFRGRTVVLTFIEAHCTQLCPQVANQLHQLSVELGPEAQQVQILAITADPEGDSPGAVRTFSVQHGMWKRWLYLTASRATLTPVWHRYYVYVAPKSSSKSLDSSHTSATYIIDSRGRERVLMGGSLNVQAVEQDVRMLAGLPLHTAVQLDAAPQVGHPAPDFTVRTPAGKSIALRSLRGKVVLVNFWATYCVPCRTEMPELASWYREMRGKPFTIVGIDQQEGASATTAYARKLGIPYPVALDPDGTVGAEYYVVGLPTSFLIDQNGIVRASTMGDVRPSFLTKHVRPLVAADHGR
jgi:protein SCO1